MIAGDRITYFDLPPAEREGVLDRLRVQLSGFPEVCTAWAYGSFVRGEKFRDLDIGLVLDAGTSWRIQARITAALDDALGHPEWPLDVVDLAGTSPAFRHRIATEGRMIHEREPGEGIEFAVQARSQTIDFETWRRCRDRETT